MARVYCPQCQALAVNGMPLHEIGCPYSRRKWAFKRTGRGIEHVCLPESIEVPEWMKPKKKGTSEKKN